MHFNFKWTHCVERKGQADSSAKQQLKEFWETYAKYKIHFKPETVTRDKAGYVIEMEIPIGPKDDSKHNNTQTTVQAPSENKTVPMWRKMVNLNTPAKRL